MSAENNITLNCDQYEDLKDSVIKALKLSMSGGGTADSGQIMRKLDENTQALNRANEQVATCTNRIGQMDFKPIIKTLPPDVSGIEAQLRSVHGSLEQIGKDGKQHEMEIKALQKQVAQLKTEVDTTEFEKISRNTTYEMQQQIRYLKQPPIVLTIIVGLFIVSLLTTLAAGFYIRDRREWKSVAKYWYEQSQQSIPPKTNKKSK